MSDPAPRRRPRTLFWLLIALLVALIVAVIANIATREPFGVKTGDLAQFGYLVVILIFVGSAFFGRNLGAREVLRAIAGWLAIILIAVGTYAYRTELTAIGGRLLGVLVPGLPVSGRLAGEADSAVVISRTIDGHFGVRAEVNDTPLALMVDTGASFVTLTSADAAAVGIDTSALRFTVPIRTANGMIVAAPVVIDRIAVGSITRDKISALVAPGTSLDESLLGLTFLNTLSGYTVSGDRLVLTP